MAARRVAARAGAAATPRASADPAGFGWLSAPRRSSSESAGEERAAAVRADHRRDREPDVVLRLGRDEEEDDAGDREHAPADEDAGADVGERLRGVRGVLVLNGAALRVRDARDLDARAG